MEVLDRTQAPGYKAIEEIRVPSVSSYTMDNGQPLYWIKDSEQPVIRLECIFDAGSWYDRILGQSSLTMKMLTEGTRSHTSAQISGYFDRYGAFLEQHSGTDRASLGVYCLAKYLPDLLPMVQELLSDSIIPEKELDETKNITLQKLRVNLEKNNYVAGLMTRKKVFGEVHPYGQSQLPETLEAIQQNDVWSFYREYLQHRPFRVVLSGRVEEREVVAVNKFLGCLPVNGVPVAVTSVVATPISDREPILIEKKGSLQSSIRMGRLLFKRDHPDYFPMLVFNEVLGGYFGSRLMKNIREDKGFTYSVWSNVAVLPQLSYLSIGTDVKREFTQQTIEEVWKEIRRLRQEAISVRELETVKNYMVGSFVGSMNTPFELVDRYKGILFDGLPSDYLTTYIRHLRSISVEQVQEMANKYLADGELVEIVVGGK